MKKKNLNSLSLNKKTISNLAKTVKGGYLSTYYECDTYIYDDSDICPFTYTCHAIDISHQGPGSCMEFVPGNDTGDNVNRCNYMNPPA